MQNNKTTIMKKIILAVAFITTISITAQNGYTIIVDGKEVFIKDDEVSNKVDAAVAQPNILAKSGVHIVKKGENLYSISRLYNLTVDELCKMNNIDKETSLRVEQSLKIVGFSKTINNYSNASYHIVKKGDTLYNISKRYGLTVAKLKELNNLNSNIISINQRLRIN